MKVTGILGGGLDSGAGTGPQDFAGQGQQTEEAPNVSPEEQEQYNTFVKNSMSLMYSEDGKVSPEVLKRLSTGKKPIDTLAQTAVWMTMMVEQDAKKNGMEIADDVIFHAGREILEQLAEVTEAAGLHEFKEAELQGAWYNALDMYREANSDEGDRFKPEEAASAFEALNEADKEGRADEVLPGFYQNAEQGMTMAMADQNDPDAEPDAEGDKKVLNRRQAGLLH